MAVIACDDGEVRKLGGGRTLVACIAWEAGAGPLLAGHLPVRIDGLDATGQVTFLVRVLAARLSRPVEAVMLDALTIAGFNLVSPASLYSASGVPVMVLYKRRPRWDRIKKALEDHFPDHTVRMRVLRLVRGVTRIPTSRGPLYAVLWGIGEGRATRIVEAYQVHARVPEPLRAAHLFASALSRVLILE